MTNTPEILLQAKRFRVERRSQTLADGSRHEREVVVHPGAVTIIPVLPDGRICLIRNMRVAVSETLVELPAGTLDAGEDPAATARRELIEETGYRAAHLEKLCEFFMSPGILNERMHVFLATGLTAGNTALEAGEQIESLVVTPAQALSMVELGEIRDAKTIAALLFYERFRQKVDA
jgi:ADP-ribose pyrophosphatase